MLRAVTLAAICLAASHTAFAESFTIDDFEKFFTPERGRNNDSGTVSDGNLMVRLDEGFTVDGEKRTGNLRIRKGKLAGTSAAAGKSETSNDYFTLTFEGENVASIDSVTFTFVDLDRQGQKLQESFYYNVGDAGIKATSVSTEEITADAGGGPTSLHVRSADSTSDNVDGKVTFTGFEPGKGYGFRIQNKTGDTAAGTGEDDEANLIIKEITIEYSLKE